MTCDAATLFLENEVFLTQGAEDAEREVSAKAWRREVPRDLV